APGRLGAPPRRPRLEYDRRPRENRHREPGPRAHAPAPARRRARAPPSLMDETPIAGSALAVGVRFRPAGKIYDFDPGPLILAREDRVLVETERGPALGTVIVPPRPRPAAQALQRVIKKADARAIAREDQNLQRERQH